MSVQRPFGYIGILLYYAMLSFDQLLQWLPYALGGFLLLCLFSLIFNKVTTGFWLPTRTRLYFDLAGPKDATPEQRRAAAAAHLKQEILTGVAQSRALRENGSPLSTVIFWILVGLYVLSLLAQVGVLVYQLEVLHKPPTQELFVSQGAGMVVVLAILGYAYWAHSSPGRRHRFNVSICALIIFSITWLHFHKSPALPGAATSLAGFTIPTPTGAVYQAGYSGSQITSNHAPIVLAELNTAGDAVESYRKTQASAQVEDVKHFHAGQIKGLRFKLNADGTKSTVYILNADQPTALVLSIQSETPEDLAYLKDEVTQIVYLAPNGITPTLLTARQGYKTTITTDTTERTLAPEVPPANLLQVTSYQGPLGAMAAYITPDPQDGAKHPAVLWAHGGFNGIDNTFWKEAALDNDQSARAFREAGIVEMIPAWRGENHNPGTEELFYGEVDDLLAARDYLASLPWVDPNRIYLAGHSTGGTLVLLAAEATDKFRAAFVFGGMPIVVPQMGFDNVPFDPNDKKEWHLRSSIFYLGAIKKPVFYFEGSTSPLAPLIPPFRAQLAKTRAPVSIFVLDGYSHFSDLAPVTKLLAAKILSDTDDKTPITITDQDLKDQ